MAEDTKAAEDKKPAEDTTPPSGGRTASEFRDIADALRNRTDLFGKTLAAIATTGTAAVGLKEIGDLFPAEGFWGWFAVVVACAGLAVAALAAIWVAVRLMGVARPVFIGVDLDANDDLSEPEREEVRPVFKEAARRFGYTSLIGLQERERSLRNAASRANDKDERARRTALADEVKTEIEQAKARGQVMVIRRRSAMAVTGRRSWFLYAAVIGGLIMFAAGTDWVSSDRRDRVAEAKACGEARKAMATPGELGRTKGVCDGEAQKVKDEPKPPSVAEARGQITEKLAATLAACTALVQEAGEAKGGPLKDEDCDPVRAAVSGMDPAGR
jgi:hypothetical protein